MQTPQSSVDGRSTKRMRLGTRSCTHCRRRKVRCIYPEGSKVCVNCEKHHIQCIPQQASGGVESSPHHDQEAQERLQDLEGMVRSICKAIDLDIMEANITNFETRVSEALKNYSQSPASTASYGATNSGFSSPESDDTFVDAPLINLFHSSMIIRPHGAAENKIGNAQSPAQGSALSRSSVAKLHIPEPHDLVTILHSTVDFWEIWSAFPKDLFTVGCDKIEKVALARQYITNCLKSERASIVAKAILMLGIAIQQLPNKVKAYTNIPKKSNDLIDSYLRTADRLLADEVSARTIDGLECLLLQIKIYVNMGKPRQAWLCNRRALDCALLLRLHVIQWNNASPRNAVWSQIWQTDRQLSLLLGLPYGISETQLNLSSKYTGPISNEPVTKILQDLSILAGHINDRNQHDLDEAYPMTLELDQRLQAIKESIPSEWWSITSSSMTPVHVIYGSQTLKIYVFMMEKILHMPYLLKSSTDPRYMYSRAMALEASRYSVLCYQVLRDNSASETLSCDLMDFIAFSSAITIVIDLLSPHADSDLQQENNDWEIIRSVSRTLERVSQELDCSVASQASQLLTRLIDVGTGVSPGLEDFETVIPYFGKIRISVPAHSTPIRPMTEAPTGQVEFNTNFLWQNDHLVDSFDAELGIDWASIVPDQESYDWNQVFQFTAQS